MSGKEYMHKFEIMCLLIIVLILTLRAQSYLVVKVDNQLQNEERIGYVSAMDSETIENADAKNMSLDSYIFVRSIKGLFKATLWFCVGILILRRWLIRG